MLQTKIQQFDQRTQQFCNMLNMTWAEVETLKETDSPEGNMFYTGYMNFMQGIYPSKDFIQQYCNKIELNN